MSDPAPAAVSVDAPAPAPATAPDPVPAPAPAPAPTPAPDVDFEDMGALLKFALTKIAEVELEGESSLDDKVKKVSEAIKAEIRKGDLPASVRVLALDWCDDALPHVIAAIDLVKAELKKAAVTEITKVKDVALAEVRKCCPSFFAKKV